MIEKIIDLLATLKQLILETLSKIVDERLKDLRDAKRERKELAESIYTFIESDEPPLRINSKTYSKLRTRIPTKYKQLHDLLYKYYQSRFIEFYFVYFPAIKKDLSPFDEGLMLTLEQVGKMSEAFKHEILREAYAIKVNDRLFRIKKALRHFKYSIFAKKKMERFHKNDAPLSVWIKGFHKYTGYDLRKMEVKKKEPRKKKARKVG